MYLPRFFILKAKIQGHIIEQHKPPLKNANNAIFPVEKIPIIMENKPRILNKVRVFCAFSLNW